MIQLYESKGFTTEDATLIISTMCKYEQFFVDHMLVQELGILPPDEDDNPAFDGKFPSFLTISLYFIKSRSCITAGNNLLLTRFLISHMYMYRVRYFLVVHAVRFGSIACLPCGGFFW